MQSTLKTIIWTLFAILISTTVIEASDLDTVVLTAPKDTPQTRLEAWQTILVRLSGDLHVWQKYPALQTIKPAQYLSTYNFTACPKPNTQQNRCIGYTFNQPAIQALLTQQDIPFWGTPRPHVLIWVFIEKQHVFLPMQQFQSLQSAAKNLGKFRGLFLTSPTLDLQDLQHMTNNQGQIDPNWQHIAQASKRYHNDTILLGIIHPDTATSQWTLRDHQEMFTWTSSAHDTAQAALQKGLHHVADHFVNQPQNKTTQRPPQTIRMWIHPVPSLEKMSHIVEHFSQYPSLTDVKLNQLTADGIEVQALRRGSSHAFQQHIDHDPNITLDTEADTPNNALALIWHEPNP